MKEKNTINGVSNNHLIHASKIDKKDSLGIPNYGVWYIATKPNQNAREELIKIHEFIKDVLASNRVAEFQGKYRRIQFINYGSTQLVYVLTIDENRQYTLLVTQPSANKGIGKKEFSNLNTLSKKSNLVVKPLYYFQDEKRELYVTPYFYQSRCIGIDTEDWGMWIPEPTYHFKEYSTKERNTINSAMVSALVSLYDDERKLGLSECRLDGGDFMLEKGFERDNLDIENILKNMKLIAARNLVEMSLEEYISQMKRELLGKEEKNIILGKKIKCPMTEKEVDEGIQYGLKLRNKNKENQIHR